MVHTVQKNVKQCYCALSPFTAMPPAKYNSLVCKESYAMRPINIQMAHSAFFHKTHWTSIMGFNRERNIVTIYPWSE